MKSRKPTYEYLTREAAEPSARWSRRDQLLFHCFNPNGLIARKHKADERISAAVKAGRLAHGAIIAYGTFNSFYPDRLLNLVTRKTLPRGIEIWVAVNGLREACEKAEAVAAEVGF